jgi:hypothetical protein
MPQSRNRSSTDDQQMPPRRRFARASGPGQEPEEPPAGSAEDDRPVPARQSASVGSHLQATLVAADTAAEEILDAARAEAREIVARTQLEATSRTDQLQHQAETLMARATALIQQTEALGEATRALTSTVHTEISVEAQSVIEEELLEPAAIEAPRLDDEPEVADVETVEGPEPAEEPADPEPDAPTAVAEAAAPEQATVEHEDDSTDEDADEADADEDESAVAVAQSPEPAVGESGKRARKRRLRLRRRRKPATPERVEAGAPRAPASQDAIDKVSMGNQMLARQMLLDGLDQREVEQRLREEFSVEDPGAVLDSLDPTSNELTEQRRGDQ